MRKILHDVVRFESFDEFLTQAALPPSPPMIRAWGGGDLSGLSSIDGTKKFTGTRDYDEALKLAREGWKAGRDKMATALDSLTPYVQAVGTAPTGGFDIAGFAPCVPAYIAGEPACMYSMGETFAQTSRIVRFCVSMSIVCSTDADHIRNRGAAILAVMEYLEAIGLRVEIELAHCADSTASAYNDAKTGERIDAPEGVHAINECYIPVKRSDESVELDRLAFMLGHPSVLRRFIFRIDEQHVAAGYAMRGNYGFPKDIKPDFDQVYFPALRSSYEYATPESALKHVLTLVKQKLSEEQQARFGEDWHDLLTDTRVA